MSRSNPNTGSSNPSTRWHEWAGDKGILKYYDKAQAATVEVPLPFTFILLDETATVKGWHDASESGIYANEVRDTRQEGSGRSAHSRAANWPAASTPESVIAWQRWADTS